MTRLASNVWPIALAAALIAGPALGAGFGIFEQGTKAMGTAGAFTGQADDLSAMFHNVGGLAFAGERSLYAGLTLINPLESTFSGADPFPGTGARAEVDTAVFTPVHVYWAKPLSDRLTFGAALYSPFGLSVEWDDPASFPGRFISTKSELVSFDLNANVGYKINDRVGVGFGIIGRAAEVELRRRVPVVNPFDQTVFDAARVVLKSDFDFGLGFNAGLLYKVNPRFSWGVSYRSEIDVDFGGDGRFTQLPSGNAQLDALVARSLPFGGPIPISTSIDFPAMASLGASVGLTPNTRLNADVNWTGWSSFDVVDLDFRGAPALNTSLVQDYDDAYNYRLGVTWTTAKGNQVRFGYVFDETPQPDETTGPVLPDADRNGFTVGFGTRRFDVAAMYLLFDDRTTTVNRDGFFGTYNTEVALFAFSWKL